jgi:hypothetical protein
LARGCLNPGKPYNLRFECALKHGIGFSILTAIILTLIDVLVLMESTSGQAFPFPFFNGFLKEKYVWPKNIIASIVVIPMPRSHF